MNKVAAGIVLGLLILWIFHELAYGGGDPNDPQHNRPPWSLW